MRGKGRGLGSAVPLFKDGSTTFCLSDWSDYNHPDTSSCKEGGSLNSGWSHAHLNTGSVPMEGDDRHGGQGEVCAFLMPRLEPGLSEILSK